MSSLDQDKKYYNENNCGMTDSYHATIKLESSLIDTALGRMVAIADSNSLYLLEFLTRVKLPNQIRKLKRSTKSSINHSDSNSIIKLISSELDAYYKGELRVFKTSITLLGTQFQKNIWTKLLEIPFGKTVSYMDHALASGAPESYRATANAIGANNFAIIVPCHRVIKTSGEIGGYAGGVELKKALLAHERGKL